MVHILRRISANFGFRRMNGLPDNVSGSYSLSICLYSTNSEHCPLYLFILQQPIHSPAARSFSSVQFNNLFILKLPHIMYILNLWLLVMIVKLWHCRSHRSSHFLGCQSAGEYVWFYPPQEESLSQKSMLSFSKVVHAETLHLIAVFVLW